MDADEVLAQILRARRDQLGISAADVVDIVVLEDVAARGLGGNDRRRRAGGVALAQRGGEDVNVVAGILAKSVEIALMQVRCPATLHALGQGALDAVALEHLHHVVSDTHVLVFDEARREQRHSALWWPIGRGIDRRVALVEPRRESLL